MMKVKCIFCYSLFNQNSFILWTCVIIIIIIINNIRFNLFEINLKIDQNGRYRYLIDFQIVNIIIIF